MPIGRIMKMTGRAFLFAGIICLLYAVIRFFWLKIRGHKPALAAEGLRLLLVCYLAALLQITVIRGGVPVDRLFSLERSFAAVQLVPLYYTVMELKNGLWAFIYPLFGNLLWFFPYGFLLPAVFPQKAGFALTVGSGALCSLAIESLQWVFGSGISDIDDLLFNAAGTALGYGVFLLWKRWRNTGLRG